MSTGESELERLRAENTRLVSLLEANGVEWRLTPASAPQVQVEPESQRLSTTEKLVLFRRLFHGRDDVHAVRWESKATGKSGYAPACQNEWRPGICEKPRVKCSDCGHRKLSPLTDAVLYAHLAGDQTIGVYPLLEDDSCHFLAADFDDAEWREDAGAFVQSCRELGVPVALYPSDSPHPSVPRLPRQVLRLVLSRFASVARSSLGSLVWFMRVCAASRSRLSARGYCRAQGWSYATFMAWRRRLVRELAGAPLRFERRR